MTRGKKWLAATLVAVATAGSAAAQTGGIGSGGQTGGIGLGGGSGLTSGGLTSGGLAGTLNSSNVGGGSGVGAGGLGGNTGMGSQQPIATNGISPPTGQTRSSLDASNLLSGYYANPYFAGLTKGYGTAPGGFGTQLYSSTGTGAAAGRTGTAAGRTGLTGLGGVGGNRAGLGGTGSQSGIVVPIPVQINYAAQLRFAAPVVAAPALQADIQNSLANTHLIPDGRGVQVITDGQNNVTLRGRVQNEDEARLVEGVVRLTPGVRVIQNELTFPATAGK
jgi:hypothetical protein